MFKKKSLFAMLLGLLALSTAALADETEVAKLNQVIDELKASVQSLQQQLAVKGLWTCSAECGGYTNDFLTGHRKLDSWPVIATAGTVHDAFDALMRQCRDAHLFVAPKAMSHDNGLEYANVENACVFDPNAT